MHFLRVVNLLNKTFIVFIIGLFCYHSVDAKTKLESSNKQASKEAAAVYNYLQDMYGKKTLSGQMNVLWSKPDELNYIKTVTGKLPAIRGLDFDSTDVVKEVRKAIHWWKAKHGIPTIMWHWGATTKGGGYNNANARINIKRYFQKGTPEYKAMWKDLTEKAKLLQTLKKANVPVLWRPFHKFNGNYFWWSKQGPWQFRRLWANIYNYFLRKKKLNNLIWVLSFLDKPHKAWYPGRKYVDIVGADAYPGNNNPQLVMYNELRSIVGNIMPIAYTECQEPPSPDDSFSKGARWSYWMIWHAHTLPKVDKNYLKQVYNHTLVITLDELPKALVTAHGNKRG